ncbi:helix-turn-helix domain-containing protein [Nonomuraea ferruginea]
MLRILRKHDRLSAGQLAEQLAVPRPTLSGHLNVLKGGPTSSSGTGRARPSGTAST